MRKIAAIFAVSLSLAACQPTGSSIFLPMEPTQASIDAPRRELTEEEKDAISDAVMQKLQDPTHRDFHWSKLVVRRRERTMTYCGLVSEFQLGQSHESFRKFQAELTFNPRGQLSKVDVVAITIPWTQTLPSVADSLCIQAGYNVSP
jgi:hypothetical protein